MLAAWDPANALVELSKDFTAKTGVQMKYEFVPWPNFAQRMLNELNSRGKLCDLLIGDSQWIGSAATEGHYIELTDFFAKNSIKDGRLHARDGRGLLDLAQGLAALLGAAGDGRRGGLDVPQDWFAKPELQKEFKAKFNRDLAPPSTWDELKQVAQFFQGRMIERQEGLRRSALYRRGSEGITMGVTNTMYAWGMEYDNPKKPYEMKGFINSRCGRRLQVLQGFYDWLHAAGHANAYMTAKRALLMKLSSHTASSGCRTPCPMRTSCW